MTASERKRQAIASAALALFARDGYERTSVDAIAAEAGVSKRTVYSHYGDKEQLFMLVVRDTYELMRERFAEAAEVTLRDVDDVEKSLVSCLREAVRAVTQTPERARLVRLITAELPRFPALAGLWQGRGLTPLLAAPIERLAAAGLLTADDPMEAAGHLSARPIETYRIRRISRDGRGLAIGAQRNRRSRAQANRAMPRLRDSSTWMKPSTDRPVPGQHIGAPASVPVSARGRRRRGRRGLRW